jgi:RcsF protein
MIKKLLIALFVFLVTSTLVASCSNHYVSTNLDKENFSQYFSASKVKIYNSEKDIHHRYKFIVAVEGQDCQIKSHHAVPDEINARTQARQQAFENNANGVVFSGCALLSQDQLSKLNESNDAKQCHAIVICYAKAYAIEAKSDAND